MSTPNTPESSDAPNGEAPQQPQYAPPPQLTQDQLQQQYGQQQRPQFQQQPQYAPPQYPIHPVSPAGQQSYGPTPRDQGQYAQSQQQFAYQQQAYTYQQPQYYAGTHWRPGPGEPFDGAIHDGELNRPLYGATMSQAFTRFFKNYANFTGRASRSEYWWLRLWLALAYIAYLIVSLIISSMIFSADPYQRNDVDAITGIFGVILFLAFLGLVVPMLALHWRRLHDANLAGPMLFLSLIPLAGNLIVFIFTLLGPRPEGRRFDRPYR